MKEDLVRFGLRVVTVVEAADHSVQVKLDKKRKLADQAAVASGDVDMLSMDSVKSYVDKAIKLARDKTASSSSSSSKVSSPLHARNITTWDNLASFIQEAQVGWVPEDVWLHAGAASTAEAVASTARQERSEARRSPAQKVRSQTGSWQEGFQGQGKGSRDLSASTAWGDHVPPVVFRYDSPASYPDWLLTIPTPLAIDYLHICTPVDVLRASQYKSMIHASPGVILPKVIAYELSGGMRFMFHSKRNSDLIKLAWHDFVRRLRWRLYFSFSESDNTDYDPDYEVDRPKKRVAPPSLPPYIEHGITLGRNFVYNTISKVPSETPEDVPYSSLAPPVNMLRSFLLDNNYIITM